MSFLFSLKASSPPHVAQAWIKMEFETLIESPDGELLSYIDQSLSYTPVDVVAAALNTVLIETDSSIDKESCVLIE